MAVGAATSKYLSEDFKMRSILLFFLGVPIPVIILIAIFFR
jgi:hypothetical protein